MVWYGTWLRNGNVDGLKRYLMYGVGIWMVWKGVQSMDWVCS
jgi:hypothetical protein